MVISKVRRYLFYIVFVVTIILAMGIALNNHRSDDALTISMITNIDELSEEFMNNYFEEYAEMRNDETSDPENMLIVVSMEEPENYGAKKVVEAPNHTYFLQYNSEEEKDNAFNELNDDNVISVEENDYILPAYNSWGIEKAGLSDISAAANKIQSPNTVTVAVMDTGLALDAFTYAFPNKTVLYYCVTACVEPIDDVNGHGTHVTGTIAEGTPNNVQILSIKTSTLTTINDKVVSVFQHSDMITAINYALSQHVDVLNMSVGGAKNDSYYNAEVVALQALKDSGTICVAAAGNEGNKTNYISYPAAYDSTISIAAVDSNLQIGVFSSYNEYVDFAAPGVAITSLSTEVGKKSTLNGTSMAAPHVSAIVANLKSFNKNLTFDQVKELLKAHAVDLGDEGRDDHFGWGFIDVSDLNYCSSGKRCDEYGVFVDTSFIINHAPNTISYSTDGETITLDSSRACRVLTSINGSNYDLVPAIATDSENRYDYTADNSDNAIHLYLAGDVNLNGEVNSSDALAIAKYKNGDGPLNTVQLKLADINRNTLVNSSDALFVAKDYSGISAIPW